jgi:hypothetical protein
MVEWLPIQKSSFKPEEVRLDINLENEILEISRSFQLFVHAARGG